MRDEINKIHIAGERCIAEEYRARGCRVYKPTWPTLLVLTPEGRTLLVEVKRRGERVSANQAKTHALLTRAGFTVVVERLGGISTTSRMSLAKEREELERHYDERMKGR